MLYSPDKYRETEGIKNQQNAIDKVKGITCKPMPRYWHDRVACSSFDNDELKQQFNLSILADKKPYFMRYIYPALMQDYNTYIKNSKTKCLREFRVSMDELLAMDESELTEEQAEFIYYYQQRMPVGTHDCVMNRICKRFEEEFNGIPTLKLTDDEFDASIMKSGCEYTQRQYNAVKKLFDEHNQRLQDYTKIGKKQRQVEVDQANYEATMVRYFEEECLKICSNMSTLCDIIIDLCYGRCGTMQFAWDVVGNTMLENLIRNNGGKLSFPVEDENGDILFGGRRFSMTTVEVTQGV